MLVLLAAGGCSSDPAALDAGAERGDARGSEDARAADAEGADGGAGDAAASDTTAPEDGGAAADATSGDAGTFRLPPINEGLDYQLGGAYPPPAGVTVLSRDRNASPAAGLYNICYVNGFQIQPDEVNDWATNHPDLMLRDAQGDLVIDPDWNEILIDIRTPEKRADVAAVVGAWIHGCRVRGYDAVEIDNLDSFSRSSGLLTEADAVATMRLFSDAAHAEGLAIAQKNSAELVPRRAELGTDFAVAEECNRYSECEAYTRGYGDHVLVIEYRRADFSIGCASYPNLSIVLRDRNLVTPGNAAYVYDGC